MERKDHYGIMERGVLGIAERSPKRDSILSEGKPPNADEKG